MSIEITQCRLCGNEKFEQLVDLGEQPLANGLVKEKVNQPCYPLVVVECTCCGHVQLKHTIEPTELFLEYAFHTASSSSMVQHFSKLIQDHLPESGLVVEIGSNDGAVLETIKQNNIIKLGIDPSINLCEEAARRGVNTYNDFFGTSIIPSVVNSYGRAKLIVCCNVLGHVHDLTDFVRAIKLLLAPGGTVVIEVPYVYDLHSKCAFDTIYVEHISYFSISSVVQLFNRHGMGVQSIEPQKVHGGTNRYVITHDNNSNQVKWEVEKESHVKLNWTSFNEALQQLRHNLVARLNEYKEKGLKVVGYGAAAKAAVMLNYCGIGTDLLPMIVDCTEYKQGLLMPGTFQLVVHPKNMLEYNPDVILILAWNHAAEIVNKEHDLVSAGKIFITPDLVQVLALPKGI